MTYDQWKDPTDCFTPEEEAAMDRQYAEQWVDEWLASWSEDFNSDEWAAASSYEIGMGVTEE